MDIRHFAPYLEARKKVTIQGPLQGRWIEKGYYEDVTGDGLPERMEFRSLERCEFGVEVLDFKNAYRLVAAEYVRLQASDTVPEYPDLDPIPDPRDLFGADYASKRFLDEATSTHYQTDEAGELIVRRGDVYYMDYRFDPRNGDLSTPRFEKLIIRLDATTMLAMDHDQFRLPFPTYTLYGRIG